MGTLGRRAMGVARRAMVAMDREDTLLQVATVISLGTRMHQALVMAVARVRRGAMGVAHRAMAATDQVATPLQAAMVPPHPAAQVLQEATTLDMLPILVAAGKATDQMRPVVRGLLLVPVRRLKAVLDPLVRLIQRVVLLDLAAAAEVLVAMRVVRDQDRLPMDLGLVILLVVVVEEEDKR